MAEVKILLQGLEQDHDHETAIKELLGDDSADNYLLSVAFARTSGINRISDRLHELCDRVRFYIGIANGVTSIQSIQSLLDLGISPYLIDMGSNRRIYHPKIYAAFKEETVDVILGSANMTYPGLNENIEASTVMVLTRSNPSDLEYIKTVETTLLELHNNFPEHVTLANNSATIQGLLNEGRLEDETVRREAVVSGHRTGNARVRPLTPFPVIVRRRRTVTAPIIQPRVAQLPQGVVWRSRELSERDLNIPTGTNTNATGSMYFKKGLLNNVDQRHYFRDQVFSNLNWQPDPSRAKAHLERAVANFELIINGISIGTYQLRLTHNTRTNTATYRQNNAMTQVHWGISRDIIGDRRLLGKFMTLYHLGNDNFQMDIN